MAAIFAGEVETGVNKDGQILWKKATDPLEKVSVRGLLLKSGQWTLLYRERLFLAFHKPPDTECSHAPGHHRSVFGFFPEPFLRRGLQSVGRLDADTTGLLLLSDHGPFNHFMTSPRRHVPKTYRVEAKHPITVEQVGKLAAGVSLRGEENPTRPAHIELSGEKQCQLTIEEGKYHQVKRMFGAVGNRVETIHRTAVGGVKLEESLTPGQWRYLTEGELTALGFLPET